MSKYSSSERVDWIKQQLDAGLYDQAFQMLFQWVKTGIIKLPEFKQILKSFLI